MGSILNDLSNLLFSKPDLTTRRARFNQYLQFGEAFALEFEVENLNCTGYREFASAALSQAFSSVMVSAAKELLAYIESQTKASVFYNVTCATLGDFGIVFFIPKETPEYVPSQGTGISSMTFPSACSSCVTTAISRYSRDTSVERVLSNAVVTCRLYELENILEAEEHLTWLHSIYEELANTLEQTSSSAMFPFYFVTSERSFDARGTDWLDVLQDNTAPVEE